MRVLITGAGGWIARHLVERMSGAAELYLHFRRPEEAPAAATAGDLSQAGALDAVPAVHVVVHLAGRTLGPPRDLYLDHVVATAALLEWMRWRDVPRIVFASTGAVYANSGSQPSRETDSCEPIGHYAASKAAAEAVVRQFVLDSRGALAATLLRLPHVYGPGQRKGVIWKFLDDATRSGKVLLDGEGAQERDFLFIDDAAAALQSAVEHEIPGATELNVGTGIKTPLAALAPLLSETLGRPVAAEPSGRPELPPRYLWLDPRRARQVLHWTASIALPDGLKRTAAWRLSLS